MFEVNCVDETISLGRAFWGEVGSFVVATDNKACPIAFFVWVDKPASFSLASMCVVVSCFSACCKFDLSVFDVVFGSLSSLITGGTEIGSRNGFPTAIS